MDIKDPDARRAVETIIDEFEMLEDSVQRKDTEISDLEEKNEELSGRVEELELKVKELEEALAEAYLTEDVDGTDEEE